MQEQDLGDTNDRMIESDPLESSERRIDLSFLNDPRWARTTLRAITDSAEEAFEDDWRGGVREGHTFRVVKALLSEMEQQKLSTDDLEIDSQYAIAQALQRIDAPFNDEQLLKMRQEVEEDLASREQGLAASAGLGVLNGIEEDKGRGLTKRRLFVLFTAAVLASLALSGSQSRSSRVYATDTDSRPVVTGLSTLGLDVAQGETARESVGEIISQFTRPIQEAVGEFINPIPLVEDVESDSENPNIVLGIDWTNTEAGVSVAWDDPEIAASRLGISPEIILFPVAKKENINMMDQCLPFLGLDCSWVHDGSITVGAHVGSDDEGTHFSFQDLKDSLERKAVVEEVVDEQGNTQEKITWVPLSIDEQKEIIAKLESVRPTVRQVIVTERDGKKEVEVVEVKAKVAIVRIPPLEADRHYAAWFDYNRDDVIKIALEVDPTLGERVNLNKDFVVIIGCDERLPEEPYSQRIDPSSTYQAMWLTFLGEAPAGQL